MEQNYSVKDILAKVAGYYGVSVEELTVSDSRRAKVIKARMALHVVLAFLRLPDKGLLKRSRTMPQWFLKNGLSDFQTLRPFRNEVREIVGAFDAEAFIVNANRYPHVTDMVRERMRSMMIKPLRRGQKFSEIKERVIRANYTQAENRAIDNACLSSAAFMAKYGQVTEKSPMLKGHYEQGLYTPLKEIKQ